MIDVATEILDAAEQRMRAGGFNGFSFREIAVDVGVKSSSVHYHFPTKEKLAAAVIHRYTDEVSELFERELKEGVDLLSVFTTAFRGTLSEDGMCPCIVLAAGALDLPEEVAAEVKRFFNMSLDKLVEAGLTANAAAEFLSTITGAMLIANVLDDAAIYDRATTTPSLSTGSEKKRPSRALSKPTATRRKRRV